MSFYKRYFIIHDKSVKAGSTAKPKIEESGLILTTHKNGFHIKPSGFLFILNFEFSKVAYLLVHRSVTLSMRIHSITNPWKEFFFFLIKIFFHPVYVDKRNIFID